MSSSAASTRIGGSGRAASAWTLSWSAGTTGSSVGAASGMGAVGVGGRASRVAGTARKNLRRLWDLYVKDSTVHGVVYVGSATTPRKERLAWLAAIVGMAVVAHLITAENVWGPGRYRSSTRIANAYLQPTQFPFPALSLCPLNKIRKRVAIRLLSEHLGVPLPSLNVSLHSQMMSVLRALSSMELSDLTNIRPHVYLAGAIIHRLTDLNITDFMLKVLPTCDELFERCLWQGVRVDCCKLLDLQQSEMGFCYSVNSLTSVRTRHCTSVEEDATEQCTLRRTSGFGPGTGLQVFLKGLPDQDIVKYRLKRGLVVVLHQNPAVPVPAAGFLLSAGRSINVQTSVRIDWTTVSDEVLALPTGTRLCYSSREVRGWFTGIYSPSSCLVQCKTEHVLRACRCAPYMFALPGIPQCNTSHLPCLQQLQVTRLMLPPLGFPNDALPRRGINCSHCISACEVVSFNAQVNVVHNSQHVSRAGSVDIFMDPRESTVMYLVTLDFSIMSRLTIVGGIAGLCLGMSILSVVEVVYYLAKAVVVLGSCLWTGVLLHRRKVRHQNGIARLLVLPRRSPWWDSIPAGPIIQAQRQ